LSHIVDVAKKNDKKIIIDSAVVFGDRYPENMADMTTEQIEKAISLYIKKLITEFGDRIDRIDVLNSVFQRNNVLAKSGEENSEQFWINRFGKDYASKILTIVRQIVRQNCKSSNIKLCWNEFYLTNENIPERQQAFIDTISNSGLDLDVIGVQDNFRADTSCEYIRSSLERIIETCEKLGIEISITELGCTVGRADIEQLNEAKQTGNYTKKLAELNTRIDNVLQTILDFCQENRGISSVEARYSDRYDYNHRNFEEKGHGGIHTSVRRDNEVNYKIGIRDMAEGTKKVKYRAIREVGKKIKIKNHDDIGGR